MDLKVVDPKGRRVMRLPRSALSGNAVEEPTQEIE
jgi:hypothetical protein